MISQTQRKKLQDDTTFRNLRVWNTTNKPITIEKNTFLGDCSLVLMKSKAEFINKLNNMAEEAKADKVEMEKPEIPTNPPDRMDRDWIIQEFHLKDNEFLADKPELKLDR